MRAESEMRKDEAAASMNLLELLKMRAADAAKVGALQKKGGRWQEVTWGEMLQEVKELSAGLVAYGVKPGDRVAIFGATTLQWVITDLAIAAARGISIPIYASNTPDEARYVLENSGSCLAFVDHDVAEGASAGRASRVRQRLGDLPNVKNVVLFEGEASGDRETTLDALRAKGREEEAKSPSAFEERVAAIQNEDPNHFIYTSGTTGHPKGVILTHNNWAFEADSVGKLGVIRPNDSVMLFLPLAHSFAQVIKAVWIGQGCKMIFAESTEKLLANLAETRPTILPSVPRVFEKVYNNVVSNGASAPGLKGKLFRWAFRLFDEYVEAKSQGREYSSLSFTLAQKLVFSKVTVALNEKLGGNIRLFVSGGAPLSKKIAYFFELVGFKVLEGYGLTETSAASTIVRPEKVKIGTVGPALPGVELKIASDGEILMRGPNIMKGYYQNEEATKEALEPDGWFHSGDIGELDADGYLRITDRKKDIIVTAGGKNVAPQNLENQLKTQPIISQSMVYGDKRKYLSVLICVNEENARKLLTEQGITPPQGYAELSEHPEVKKAVQAALDAVNADQPSYNTLKKFAMVDHDFSQETGELTPTLKVKRKFCTQKFQPLLDSLYDEKVMD